MRIAGVQIVVAILLTGCATLRPAPGAYEDFLAVGATYAAGKLPVARINRLFGLDTDAPVEVAVGHRETRTEMGEVTHASIGLAYPEDHRCALDFSDSPARFKEFMECRTRFRDAILCVIVGEVASEDITLHTILGFHVHPRHEGRRTCGRHRDRRSISGLGAADSTDQLEHPAGGTNAVVRNHTDYPHRSVKSTDRVESQSGPPTIHTVAEKAIGGHGRVLRRPADRSKVIRSR